MYASTDEILFKALIDTSLFSEIKSGEFEEVSINSGDIMRVLPDGRVLNDKFDYKDYISLYDCNWWDYGFEKGKHAKDTYISDLKAAASYMGYSPNAIDELLSSGFSLSEIEDYIYCME